MRSGLVLLLLAAGTAWADIIYYRNGSTLKGLVVEEHHDRIVVSTEGGEKTLLRSEIEEVFYSEPERNYFYLGNQALEEGEFSLARGFFQKAAQISPGFQEAQEALQRLEDLERKQKEGPTGPPEELLRERVGLTLGAGDGLAVVAQVEPGSAAERAGVLPGDEMAATWDASLAFLPAEAAARLLAGPAGSSVKITLQRGLRLPAKGREPWPGMRLEMERLGLTVAEAETGGAAASAGFRAGDRIVRLAEEPTRYMPLGRARKLVHRARKEGIGALIHRDLLITRE